MRGIPAIYLLSVSTIRKKTSASRKWFTRQTFQKFVFKLSRFVSCCSVSTRKNDSYFFWQITANYSYKL